MSRLVSVKYNPDKDKSKYDEVMQSVRNALDEEDQIFRERTLTIHRESVRRTFK